MRRDVLEVKTGGETLILAADNSGAIGRKEHDRVTVSYETLGYFSFRTAVMECMAAGGSPAAVILQNFCGDEAWASLEAGIARGQRELGMDLPHTGSSETNMEMVQSALGILIVGRKEKDLPLNTVERIAVIGKPLSGEEVLQNPELMAPLALFKELCGMQDMVLLPVGSKGIGYEWGRLTGDKALPVPVQDAVDTLASAGPSTCFLAAYPEALEETVRETAGVFLTVSAPAAG